MEVRDIEVLKFEIVEPLSALNIKTGTAEWDYDTNFALQKFDNGDNVISLSVKVIHRTNGIEAYFKTVTDFKVMLASDDFTILSEDDITVAALLLQISFAHTRVLLKQSFAGTIIEKGIMPIENPNDLKRKMRIYFGLSPN